MPKPNPTWIREELLVVAHAMRTKSLRSNKPGWSKLEPKDEESAWASSLLRNAPFHPQADRDEKFRGPGSIRAKSENLRTARPDYIQKGTKTTKAEVEFAKIYHDNDERLALAAQEVEETILKHAGQKFFAPTEITHPSGAAEGKSISVVSRRYERSWVLRQAKIDAVLRGGGVIQCEVCNFNFAKVYGPRGEGYIEVHHVEPLHETGERWTVINDLVLLCSNCHRIIHREPATITPLELQNTMEDI
ncbi:HNH endonuclease [Brevibacterium litoralis]|uniref:HNH endonuclease n=1 Tax=Brevibacterium litoralis TaxID=3138935 RepID=UPI0032EB1902